ncbi:MAG: response regulator transcription factor [Deferribacteres bacterium]|nr:response regulator transcription factor [candidate division KSB1 bacterium]MCB9504014.1 response regulator transcription factor [Deferribacteres bacterium]
MKRILIIEDDPAIMAGLVESLKSEHYEVLTARDGQRGYDTACTENIDLILLDLMLPQKNGEEVCRDLRARGVRTPIVILTSKSQELDKVLLLELGADDYVTKPFSVREILARIKAILRRTGEHQKSLDSFSFADFHVDFKKQEVRRSSGEIIQLGVKEMKILQYFAEHEGEVVSRDDLLENVWGYEAFPTTRTVDNYMLSLRKKVEINPADPQHILTVHAVGYKFVKVPKSEE